MNVAVTDPLARSIQPSGTDLRDVRVHHRPPVGRELRLGTDRRVRDAAQVGVDVCDQSLPIDRRLGVHRHDVDAGDHGVGQVQRRACGHLRERGASALHREGRVDDAGEPRERIWHFRICPANLGDHRARSIEVEPCHDTVRAIGQHPAVPRDLCGGSCSEPSALDHRRREGPGRAPVVRAIERHVIVSVDVSGEAGHVEVGGQPAQIQPGHMAT